MRRAARIDTNHGDIVDALRAAGASVQTLASVGRGVPDLLVGYRHQNFLVEVKRPLGPQGGESKSRLTDDQRSWHGSWRGRVDVVRTVSDALALLGGA